MKKIVSIIMVFVGIGFILYPKATEHYYDYKRKVIMKELEKSINEYKQYDKEMNITQKNNNLDNNKNNNISNSKNNETYPILIIDKINFKQPILNCANEDTLKISVASINDGIKPGDIGNYAIAGHRSHTYGRNFNRLNELNIKDKIKVIYRKKEYTYLITEKFVVKPNRIDVLNSSKKEKEITLITCDPMINPKNRLIIKGKLL